MASNEGTWTVGFVLYPGCTLLDFAGATQIFSFAGYKCIWLAPTCDPIGTTEGVEVMPGATFDAAPALDVLFVPGGGSAVAQVMQDSTYIDFLQAKSPTVRYTGSICTGAFLLAAAGLLDGLEVTTYWSQRENLALFPNLTVAAGYPRWVIWENTPSGGRFTGGGISSSIDLALEMVNRLSGPTAAQATQLSTQYAPNPPFQSGDPEQAPPAVTASVLKDQETTFIQPILEATLQVIGEG